MTDIVGEIMEYVTLKDRRSILQMEIKDKNDSVIFKVTSPIQDGNRFLQVEFFGAANITLCYPLTQCKAVAIFILWKRPMAFKLCHIETQQVLLKASMVKVDVETLTIFLQLFQTSD